MEIIKRDGRIVSFNQTKIENAILKAFIAIDGVETSYARDKAHNIANYIYDIAKEKTLSVEEIQDLIEKGLMSTKRKDVARAFISYRNDRTRARAQKSNMIKMINQKIRAEDVSNQNANVDERSFGGKLGSIVGEIMKTYALDYCMSDKSKWNHVNNRIYIHDLDHYAIGDHNCLSIPFDKLLAEGFNTRQTDVRPANSINTAFQLVAVIFQLQSLQQFGRLNAAC